MRVQFCFFDESLTYTDSTQLDFQRTGREIRVAVSKPTRAGQ